LESLARSYTETAVRTIGTIMANSTDEQRKLDAADLLLSRGWGKPRQQQDIKAEHSGAVEVIIRDIAAEKAKLK